jgi:hypothetical protein
LKQIQKKLESIYEEFLNEKIVTKFLEIWFGSGIGNRDPRFRILDMEKKIRNLGLGWSKMHRIRHIAFASGSEQGVKLIRQQHEILIAK